MDSGGQAVVFRHSSRRNAILWSQTLLFPRKLRFALLPEGLYTLLGIRRSRDGSQGLRLIFQLAFQRTIGRLQEQAFDPAIGFGGTRGQLSRDLLRLRKNHFLVDDI